MPIFLTIISIFSLVFWLYRITPYLSSKIPLWYDPWIFRAYFLDYYEQLPNINLNNHDIWIKQIYEPWLSFLTNILQLIWYDVDIILSFWLVIFSIFIWIYIYLAFKSEWKIVWLIWMSLYFLSIVQYKAFWWNYYKQIIWILCMLTIIKLFERKKYIISIPLLISMFIINRPSWVFFVITFIFYKIYSLTIKKDKNIKDIIVVLISWILALLIYLPIIKYQILDMIKPLVTNILIEWSSWTFFTRTEFIWREIILLILAYYWIFNFFKRDKKIKIEPKLIHFWFLTWFLWTTFWFFFYNRFYIFYDIFIIFFASIALAHIYKEKKLYWGIIIFLAFFMQSIYYINYVNDNKKALISEKEFEKINKIPTLIEKDAVIMVTHKNYSPWLIWYTRKKIIAPWLFDWDKWSLEKRIKWWNSDWKIKCEMIKEYKKDYKNLYIWIWERQPQENLKNWKCFEEIFNWWKYIFLKIK